MQKYSSRGKRQARQYLQ